MELHVHWCQRFNSVQSKSSCKAALAVTVGFGYVHGSSERLCIPCQRVAANLNSALGHPWQQVLYHGSSRSAP